MKRDPTSDEPSRASGRTPGDQPAASVVVAFRRRASLSAAAFRSGRRRFLDAFAAEHTEGLQRWNYAEHHRLSWDYEERPELAYDGFAILRAATSNEAFGSNSPPEMRHLLEPGDLLGEGHIAITCERHRLLWRPSAPEPLLLLALLARQAGTSPEKFRRYWLEYHGPLFLGFDELTADVTLYEQHHRLEACHRRQPDVRFDGFAVEGFTSQDAFRAFLASPAYRGVVAPDESAFINKPENLRLMVGPPICLRL